MFHGLHDYREKNHSFDYSSSRTLSILWGIVRGGYGLGLQRIHPRVTDKRQPPLGFGARCRSPEEELAHLDSDDPQVSMKLGPRGSFKQRVKPRGYKSPCSTEIIVIWARERMEGNNCVEKWPWIFKAQIIILKGKRKGVGMEVWRAEAKRKLARFHININPIKYKHKYNCVCVHMCIHYNTYIINLNKPRKQ